MDKTAFYGVGIFIPVSDLSRSTKWYTEILGFQILHNDEPNAKVLMMNDNKIIFCLVRSYDFKPMVFPRNDYNVEQYFNFHTSDVENIHRLLKEKGAHVTELESFDGMRGFSLYDPDGNKYGVVE